MSRNHKGEFLPGDAHPNWKGADFAGANTGRARAQRAYPDLGICQDCGQKAARDRHHADGNTANNSEDNIKRLCRGCHNKRHGRVPPRPDPEVIRKRMTGRTPWNKGMQKAICKHGHPLTGINVRLDGKGRRHCRACDAGRYTHVA